MIRQFVFAPELRKQIEREARAALPGECCGLIEGVRRFDALVAHAAHPTRNLSERKDRFEIDPSDQFRVLRAAREAGREVIGCYHSHPNGKAEPSAFDTENAGEEEFVWLIGAVSRDDFRLAGFVVENAKFRPLPLAKSLKD